MCGRAAQTSECVFAAAKSLKIGNGDTSNKKCLPGGDATTNDASESQAQSDGHDGVEPHHNYNMSPGMDALVFWKDTDSNEIRMGKKVWGLVTKGGTPSSPIPEGMGKHFEGLMFNARSDTLYQKPTFTKLLQAGKTCLVVLDGFFEWKAELKGKKQPYYVYRNRKQSESGNVDRPYLLIAGLWTSVPTGRAENPVLETFTLLTTEVCQPLQWLHSRMPVTVWDESLAMKWLLRPSETVHRQLDECAQRTLPNCFDWHAVTPDMSSMKFRSAAAIQRLPKMKTVKSFFSAPSPTNAVKSTWESPLVKPKTTQKRSIETVPVASSPAAKQVPKSPASKKPKTGTIDSYFKQKGGKS